MPRNVTVKFADGSSHVFNGVPDNITPGQVAARATQQFSKQITNIDGGNTTQPTRNAPAVPVTTRKQAVADAARQPVQTTAGGAFVRALSDAIPFKNYIGAAANYAGSKVGLNDTPASMSYSDRVRALKTQDDTLEAADRTQHPYIHYATELAGLIGGASAASKGIVSGAAKLAESSAPAVARAGNILSTLAKAQPGQRLANVGRASLAGATAGTVAGAGESNPEDMGSGAMKGAVAGAVAGPALGGALKGASWLGKTAADFLGIRGAGAILKNITNATQEEIQQRIADFRSRTGAEPTIYEVLPKADRDAIAKKIIGSSPPVQENAAGRVRARVANMAPEMQAQVSTATDPSRQRVLDAMRQDLAASTQPGAARPVVPDLSPAEEGAVQDAATAPVDMEALRGLRTQNTLDPVRDRIVAPDVAHLYPRGYTYTRGGDIIETHTGPEVIAALNNAAGSLQLRASDPNSPNIGLGDGPPNGLTANDMASIVKRLSDNAARGGPEQGANERALAHISDYLTTEHPEVAQAIGEMRQAHAAGSRMLEGMNEGTRTRLRENIPVANAGQAQDVTNAYDTPEGTLGRVLGQSNRLNSILSGTPQEALAAIRDLAESGSTQQAVARNISPDAAAAIVPAAEAQAGSVRALNSANADTSKKIDSGLDLQALGTSLLALNPASHLATKGFALSRLSKLTSMSPAKASFLVDKLFSQDPAEAAQGISLLNSAGQQGQKFLRNLGTSLAVGGVAAGDTGTPAPEPEPSVEAPPALPEPPPPVEAPPAQDTAAPPTPTLDASGQPVAAAADTPPAQVPTVQDQSPDFQIDPSRPYGRQVVEHLFPGANITSDVRDPNSDLGKKMPNDYHVKSQNAVDLQPIPGLHFNDFLHHIQSNGHPIIEAIDETKHPSKYATGPHWHVVLG